MNPPNGVPDMLERGVTPVTLYWEVLWQSSGSTAFGGKLMDWEYYKIMLSAGAVQES